MKLHPFDECVEKAKTFIAEGHDVYQQFKCIHCGVKQTMDEPNVFYKLGKCEECGTITNIEFHGMNWMLHAKIGPK